jgi:RNA polymerase sigma-70 factor (ECF subfamily)
MEARPIEIPFAIKIRAARVEPSRVENLDEVEDKELARRVAEGDPNALALVYDRHAASIYRVLQALLGSPTDAEDALQEIFLKLATGRHRNIRQFRPYLLTAARHEAYGILRRRKREPQLEEYDLPHELANSSVDIEASGDQGYEWQTLLARLPLEQREVIALHVWEQMTFAEIASIVKVSPNTVTSRYRYGIERLRLWCREEDAHEL